MLARPLNKQTTPLPHAHARVRTLGIGPGKVTNLFKSERPLQTRTDVQTKLSYTTPNANVSTISPTLRLRFGSELSCYKSQAGGVTIATSSKIPLSPMEQRKGSLTPLALLCGLRFLRCQWSGIPDADRDTFSDAPRDRQGPPSAPSFTSPFHAPTTSRFPPASVPLLQRLFLFPQPFNDTSLINRVNGSSAPWTSRGQAPLSCVSIPNTLLR